MIVFIWGTFGLILKDNWFENKTNNSKVIHKNNIDNSRFKAIF